MKKITFLFILMASLGYSQNLLTNGNFDNSTGWTVVNQYEAANTLGSITISGGVATFNETAAGDWKHMGLYTSVVLEPGNYLFDMSMAYTDINDCWGEVYIGATEPVQNETYDGDMQILKAYNAWDCPDVKTFNGLASTSGCDPEPNPGAFEITETGTYYLMFRSGGSTYGTSGIVVDDFTLVSSTPSPEVSFTTTTSTTNLDVVFTNTSISASNYTWNFGDGIGSSAEVSPSYTYANAGVYIVTLTADIDGESTVFTVVVTVGNPENLFSNGSFDNSTGWTIINHYEEANTLGLVTIDNGVVTFDETMSGDWKHMGIYTAVDLDPGTYQFDMEMAYTDINDVWGEAFIGMAEPVQNSDYSGDQRVIKAYNAWECADIKTYSGLASHSGCDDNLLAGQFDITTAGTYYFLFRTGGSTYGSTGIVLDNFRLYNVSTLSGNDFKLKSFKIYPNPTQTTWEISFNNTVIDNVEVFDLLGKKVISVQPNIESFTLDASDLKSGIYIVKCFTEFGIITEKLIKQ